MHKMTDLSAKAWEARYTDGNTPWDLSGPTPELARILAAGRLPKKGRALIPGGGRGHDAVLLAQSGLDAHLVDFAPSALNAVLEASSRAKVAVQVYRQDFFALPKLAALQQSFDLLWEYTFYCAIDLKLRGEYAKAAHALLKPGGIFVGLFFPLDFKQAGPPFEVSRAEIEKNFAPYFELHFEEPGMSVKPRAGKEILGIFTRR
ncbi:MAG: methyltransferase domain-containing protein [Proteobacteria bacterium]|nr:MAG: methyltransferase domain-containing protein [Pseudomonadota bacterium]